MATGTKVFQNKINHIALVLDASSSMEHLRPAVIKVADAQIAHLAERSKELNMETRITVYTFADATKCVVYDMDVLRLPSIAEFYTPYGWTALMDATVQSQLDLGHTWEGYGDHSYFTIVITDGLENKSKLYKSQFSPMIKEGNHHLGRPEASGRVLLLLDPGRIPRQGGIRDQGIHRRCRHSVQARS